jgi:hypothetical protein
MSGAPVCDSSWQGRAQRRDVVGGQVLQLVEE